MKKSLVIERCGDCPYIFVGDWHTYCLHPDADELEIMCRDKVDNDCPLDDADKSPWIEFTSVEQLPRKTNLLMRRSLGGNKWYCYIHYLPEGRFNEDALIKPKDYQIIEPPEA